MDTHKLQLSAFRFIALIGLAAAVSNLHAATCTFPSVDNTKSLDNALIGYACNQSFINQAWDWYDFRASYWDDGFGYHAACNIQRPLARTFNSMYLMKATTWGWYDWSSDKIDDLRARCWKSSNKKNVLGSTWSGAFVDDRTELYIPFFYGNIYDAVRRASTIVHEARHYDKSHNADDDECDRGGSCDSSWGYNGANTYQVKFLRDFYCTGNTLITPTMRRYAADKANTVLSTGYESEPSFTFDALLTCGDADSDFVPDFEDNCPNQANENQADGDGDGVGDSCDLCPGVWDATLQYDSDNDGAGIRCDNCPAKANPNQKNSDQDGWGDACDNCPYATNQDQTDFDHDNIGDICDTDDDNDNVPDLLDNCPRVKNSGQQDTDNDGVGDVCDNCPEDANADQTDTNCNGIGDACDPLGAVILPFSPCSGDKVPVAYDKFWRLKMPIPPEVLVNPVRDIRMNQNIPRETQIRQNVPSTR